MNLTCYIVDDESHAIEVLERYIEQTPGLKLLGSSTNPLKALEMFATGPAPDVTFLDVDMPQLNGLDAADLLCNPTRVIFTTSFREYGPEAFEKNAIDYLLKPIIYPRFLKAIHKVKSAGNMISTEISGDHFFVKSNIKGKFHRVETTDIKYIENCGNYITIHFSKSNESVTTYLTLGEVLSRLPENRFSRIHQSFIINHAFITSLEYAQVRLQGALALPVGGTFRAVFREKLQNHILISKRDQRDGSSI